MGGSIPLIAALRGMATLPERTAAIAAKMLEEQVKATAAAGSSPSGQGWAARKDGGRALKNAAAHIRTQAIGPMVRMILTGPDVFHQFGVRGEPVRQVIPDGGAGMPPEVAAVVDRAAVKAFEQLTGGGR